MQEAPEQRALRVIFHTTKRYRTRKDHRLEPVVFLQYLID